MLLGFDRCLKSSLLLQTRFSLKCLMFGWASKGHWDSEQVFFPLKVLRIAGIMTFSLEYIKGCFFGRCWWMCDWKWEPLQKWPVHQHGGVLPVSVQRRLRGGSRREDLRGWVLPWRDPPESVLGDHSESHRLRHIFPSRSLEGKSRVEG